MTKNEIQKIGGCLVIVLAILACDLPLLSSQSPTELPQSQPLVGIGTVIANTAAVALTQTSAVIPSATPTPTFALPVSTKIPAYTPPTFAVPTEPVVAVETIAATATLDSGSSNVSGSSSNGSSANNPIKFSGQPWTCIGISKSFPNGGTVKVRTTFTAYWTVMNTGTKTWTNNTIDFVYKSGFVNDGRKIQDLTTGVTTGGKVTVGVLFTAPKVPGEYSAIWTLKVGNNPFCNMIIIFNVVK